MTEPAVPGVEEIAQLVAGVMNRDNHALALHTARQIRVLFAPILAEKERLQEQVYREQSECAAAQGRYHTMKHRAEVAERRALAAEAALAGERERCLAIVEAQVPEWMKERSGPYWDGYREAMEDAAEDMRRGPSDSTTPPRS